MNKEYKTFEELKEELGDKFEEYMYKSNIELLDKVNQLETNRDEAIELIQGTWICYCELDGEWLSELQHKLLSILERGKE